MTTTIKRDLGILPEDKRVVFSKYVEDHMNKLTTIITDTKPELPTDDLSEYFTQVKNAMSTQGILMMNDTDYKIFDILWDNLTETEKETFNEPSDEASTDPDQ